MNRFQNQRSVKLKDVWTIYWTGFAQTLHLKQEIKHKVKKLQLKYQRYDDIDEVFKNVQVKDGGGPHFIDVICNQPITFREIKVKGEELHFDVNSCNKFN